MKKSLIAPLVILAALASSSAPLLAQTTYTWNGTAFLWSTTTNWSPPGTPGANAGDDVIIANTGTSAIINITANRTIDMLTYSRTVNAFTISKGNGSNETFTLTANNVLVESGTQTLTLRSHGSATNANLVSFDFGTLTVNGTVNVGDGGAATSTLAGQASVHNFIADNTVINSGAVMRITQTSNATGISPTPAAGQINLGNLTINGGSLRLNQGDSATSGATTNATNTFIVSSLSGTSSSTINSTKAGLTGGNTTTAVLSIQGSENGTYSGTLANGLANNTLVLSKTGTGVQTLSGNNTYSGGTTVSAGTLLVSNSVGSGTGNGSVTVSSGGTLGGNGTISGATLVSGSLNPGNLGSIGTLNITNNVTWNSGTDWVFNLGAANTSDLLNITGNFTQGTGSVFRFDFGGATHQGTFKLVDWTGSTTFTSGNFSLTNLGGGNTGTFAFNGSQLELTVVPEPTTWALITLSLVFLMTFRRRRTA